MLQKVNKPAPLITPGSNHLLYLAYKVVNPATPSDPVKRCRFDLFVRIRPGNPSPFKDQQRTWCYRGDKFTDQEYKMLRNLLNLVKNKLPLYDRIELYDNHKALDERTILKIVDDQIAKNSLNQYAMMLLNYPLPDFLKIVV